jgi:hypothetical protein
MRIDSNGSEPMQTTSKTLPGSLNDPIRSLKQLATGWGVSIDTVRRRVAAGELKVIRLSPGRVGVRASEEERYLREREGLPPAA